MAYRLTLFCKGVGEETGAGAMDRLLDVLLENGPPLFGEDAGLPPGEPWGVQREGVMWLASQIHEIDQRRLVTATPDGRLTADFLHLELRAGVRFIAEDVIAVDPDDEHGVWGSDLIAIITLSGDRPDWPLTDRIWTALEGFGSVVPWDEMSGFELAAATRRPLGGNAP
ncbi:hypothetical protein ACFQ07_20395 [Actinomadura adrarensis]|uniref:Uncharacterized protein n=1 Tax=Actinomadura adrarensis TaxID=1819600 RepID=A0ABW3CJ84_9ACTN